MRLSTIEEIGERLRETNVIEEENPHIEYTNKEYELKQANKMWDACPNCNSKMNFKMYTRKGSLGDVVIIECSECGHTKDISCTELW